MTCNCATEEQQQTPKEIHQFGPVKSNEIALIAGIHPLNCRDGELQPGAFDHKQLKRAEPMQNVSCCRRDHSSPEEVISQIVEPLRTKQSDRRLENVYLAVAEKIRDIQVEGTEVAAFCVIDCGLPEFPSHAAISYSDRIRGDDKFWEKATQKNDGRSVKIAAIAELTNLFREGVCKLDEAFPRAEQ